MINELLERAINKAKEELLIGIVPEGESKEFLKTLIKNGCPVDAFLDTVAELAEKKNEQG